MYKNKTSIELVYQWAEQNPDHIAIKALNKDITYKKLTHMIDSLAYAMQQQGVKKGDRVVTFLPSTYQSVVVAFAANRIGAAFVLGSSGYRSHEIMQRLETALPAIVFSSNPEHIELLRSEQGSFGYKLATVGLNCGDMEFNDYVNREDLIPQPVAIDPDDDIACLVYTSGSTGKPKGAVHTYTGIAAVSLALAERMAINHEDIVVSPLPINHMFGVIVGMLIPLLTGATAILIDRFCARDCMEIIQDTKATVFFGVPTMYIRTIGEYKENPQYDVSSIRTAMVAGALSSPSLIREIKEVFDIDAMVAYGMTEFIAISMTKLDDDLDTRCNSVGTLMPGVECKIVDDDGNEVPIGCDGEMWARGPWTMKEYMNNPEMTKTMKDEEGWIHSGDIVRMDENGVISIRGRKKDLIIRGGRNIYPGEVEKLYGDYENIKEITIVGAPHEVMGEQTVAFVALRDKDADTVESLRSYVKTKAIGYMAPDCVFFMDEIPKLANGKVDKVTLKALAKELTK